MITYYDCIPMINQLNQIDKLHLMQWLSKQIALGEDANQMENPNQTGLCGIWQDSRDAEEISQNANRKPSSKIAGKGKILGDIVSPVVPIEDWNVLA